MENQEPNVDISFLREKVINYALIIVSSLSASLTLLVFIFSVKNGFTKFNEFISLVVLSLILILISIFRNKLNYTFKIIAFSLIVMLAVSINLVNFGFLANSRIFMVTLPLFLAFLIPLKRAFFVLILIVVLYVTIGLLYYNNILYYSFDINIYLSKLSIWIISSLIILISSLSILFAGHFFIKRIQISYMKIIEKEKEISQTKEQAEKDIFNTMINSEETERARYAKELHDGLGPLLSTSTIYLDSIKKKVNDENLIEYIDRTNGLIMEAIQSIKDISNNLSPEILTKYGLIQAVRSFIEKLKLISDVHFEINSNLTTKLSQIQEFTLYRTIIELINNSIKYADATQVQIIIQETSQILKITYSDDGRGFDCDQETESKNGFGLLNIENRIIKINGLFHLTSKKNQGIKVDITLNLN